MHLAKTKIFSGICLVFILAVAGLAFAQSNSDKPKPPTPQEIDAKVEMVLEKGPDWKNEIRSLFLEKLQISLPYTVDANKSYNSNLGHRYANFVTSIDKLQAAARNPTGTDFVYFRWQYATGVEVGYNAILEDFKSLPGSEQGKRELIADINADFATGEKGSQRNKLMVTTVSDILPIVCDGRTFQVESEKNDWIATMTFEPSIKQKVLQNQTQGLASEFVELHKNTGKKNIEVIYSYVTRVQNTEDEIVESGPFTIALKPNQIFGLIAAGKENFQKVYEDIGGSNMTSPLAGEDGFQFTCKVSEGKSLFSRKKKQRTVLRKAPVQKPKPQERKPSTERSDTSSATIKGKLLGTWQQETGISMGGPRVYEFQKGTVCEGSTDVVQGDIVPCHPSTYVPYSVQGNTLTINWEISTDTYQINFKGEKLEITYPDGVTKWLFRKVR